MARKITLPSWLSTSAVGAPWPRRCARGVTGRPRSCSAPSATAWPQRDRSRRGVPASTPGSTVPPRGDERLGVDRHAEARVAPVAGRRRSRLFESTELLERRHQQAVDLVRIPSLVQILRLQQLRDRLLGLSGKIENAQPTLMLTSGDSGSTSRAAWASAIDSPWRPSVASRISIEGADAREFGVERDRRWNCSSAWRQLR